MKPNKNPLVDVLKELFYHQHFNDYMSFLMETRVGENANNQMTSVVSELTQYQAELQLNVKNNPEDERAVAASVDEFFEFFAENEKVLEYFKKFLYFVEDNIGKGNQEEARDKIIEDTIIRIITRHFWGLVIAKDNAAISLKRPENAKKYNNDTASKKIIIDDTYKFEDLDKYDYTDVIRIIGCLINYNSKGNAPEQKIVCCLHAVRTYRNETTHDSLERLFKLKDVVLYMRFKLYTLIGTVFCLHRCLARRGFIDVGLEEYEFKESCTLEIICAEGIPMPHDIQLININSNQKIPQAETRIVFLMRKYIEYYIKIDQWDNNGKNLYLTWNTGNPTLTWDGNNGIYSPDEFQHSTFETQASYSGIMKRVDLVSEYLEQINKDVSDITTIQEDIRALLFKQIEILEENTSQIGKVNIGLDSIKDTIKASFQEMASVIVGTPRGIETEELQKILDLTISLAERRFREEMDKREQERKRQEEEDIRKKEEKEKEEERQKRLEEERREKEATRKKRIRWGISLSVITLSVAFALYLFKDNIIDHFLSAGEIIEKADARFCELFFETPQEKKQLPFNDISDIGTEYRRAIKKYEDSLRVDSTNINAHLALAHMFIQGKGKYSLSEALIHAQSAANHSIRGKGLYCYLLHSLGKDSLCYDYMFEHYLSPDSFVVGEDEYLTLTKALWLIYGHDEESRRKRTLTSTLKGLEIVNSLCDINLDAVFERAQMAAFGVHHDEKKMYYYITPDPIYSTCCLHYLTEHSYPIALLTLSEAEYNLNCIEAFINSCSFAVGAGIRQAAPLLRSRIEQLFAGTDNSKAIKYLQQIQELEEGNNFGTKMARLFRAFNSHGQKTREQTLQELDSLITRAEKGETDQYLVDLEELYRTRISLCLQLNDTLRATELAMQKDACHDTIAVRQYIKAVWLACYKDSTTAQDSITSERLINISARRGYSQAIYTWLRHNTGVDVVTLLESSFSGFSYSSNFKSVTGNMVSPGKPDPSEWIADSLWKSQPLLAWALAEYWNGQNEDLFLPYCPEEYQAMMHLMDYKKEEPYIRSQLEDYKWYCQWGLAHAIEHQQPVIAYLLAQEWLEVMDALYKYYGETISLGKNYYINYQDIADHLKDYQKELKANGRYIKPNYPLYAY